MSIIEETEGSSKKLSTPLELHNKSALKMFLFYFGIFINKKVVKSFQNGRNSKNALQRSKLTRYRNTVFANNLFSEM